MPTLKTPYAVAIALLVALLVLLPLALVMVPPLVDYPNHLLRCAILADLPHSPALQAMYAPRNELLPNLAMDWVVVPLSRAATPFVAGKIFCALVILVTVGGGLALSFALERRLTLWSFAPALLVYNHIFSYGFLNYLFGLGLMLFGLAAWIGMRERRYGSRLGVAVLFGIALFLSHLVSLFLFGMALAGFEIARWYDTPNRQPRALLLAGVKTAAIFVIPAIMLLGSPTRGEASTHYLPTSLGSKVDAMVDVLRIEGGHVDRLFSVALLLLLAGLMVSRSIEIDRRMRYVVLASIIGLIVLPGAFASGLDIDIRVPVAIALLIAAGTRVRPVGILGRACIAALVVAFFARSFQVASSWKRGESTSRQLIDDVAALPERSTLFMVVAAGEPVFREDTWSPPLINLAMAGGISKPLFFPAIFALPRQHPLAVRPELRKVQDFQTTAGLGFNSRESLQGLLDRYRDGLLRPGELPSNLGPRPHVFVLAIMQEGSPIVGGTWKDVRVVQERPRYTLFELSGFPASLDGRGSRVDAPSLRSQS